MQMPGLTDRIRAELRHLYFLKSLDEAMHVWGQRVYGKSLYLPVDFAMNLKVL